MTINFDSVKEKIETRQNNNEPNEKQSDCDYILSEKLFENIF